MKMHSPILFLILFAFAGARGEDATDSDSAEADSGNGLQAAPDSVPAVDGQAAAAEEALAEAEADDAAEHPLWMDAYGEGAFSRHDDRNLSGFTEFKIGKRFGTSYPIDPYLKTRIYRDQRDFFWNNRVDFGAGARVSLLKKVSLTVFGEVIAGQYLRLASGDLAFQGVQARIDRNRSALDQAQKDFRSLYQEVFKANLLEDPDFDRKTLAHLDTVGNAQIQSLDRLDGFLDSLESTKDSLQQVMDSLALIPAGPLLEYRAGLIFWHGWGQEPGTPAAGFAFPFRFWGEAYSDCIFSSLSRHVRTRGGGETYRDSLARFGNLIFCANPDLGFMVMEGPAGSLAAYATAYVWFDTHKDWWNNLAMAGPGLRYKPLAMLDLAIKAEYLWGRYYGRERAEDPNPYARGLRDLRVTGSFWYGLGI